MEDLLHTILTQYGHLLYPVILIWTFIEGETVVIITGAIAAEGKYKISPELLALFAFAGSFLGDQLYYYMGRKYGAPLLNRWPTMVKKIEWAFRLVQTHPTMFILSFRFIYGIRNIAPFVIGISGVSRVRYLILNFIAAMIWAHAFAWGGYLLGRALEQWLGGHKWSMLIGFVAVAALLGTWGYLNQKKKLATLAAKENAEGVCATPSAKAHPVSGD